MIMLCSTCSAHVAPVVVYDIDGTMGDYHGHFLKFAEQYLQRGRDGVNYAGQARFRDWFQEAYHVSLDEFRTIKLAYRQGGLKRSMPLYQHMDTAVREAKREGAEIWIATTRPFLRLDNIDPDTRFWLDNNRIPVDGLVYGDDKYERVAEQVDPARVVAVVDDELEQIEKASRQFGLGQTIWRRHPYNQALMHASVGEAEPAKIAGRIHMMITEWKELHHA